MAKMRVAAGAVHLGAAHEQAVVLTFADSAVAERIVEAWPAASRIEFCIG